MSFSNASATSSAVQWEKLDQMIQTYYEKVRISEETFTEVTAFIEHIECSLEMCGLYRARLDITGSFCNGFGTYDSDLDLCFRLRQDTQTLDFNEIVVLNRILNVMRGMGVTSTIIRNAKVKLVKCEDNNYLGSPIDISCYNTLPLYNTQLLAKYCQWEPKRLPALGVFVKKWAKTCHIGDASEGTLSSYAWMIMLIHYLQNCSPAVLPRLQEDFRTNDTKPELHLNCDVYFHKEVQENWSSNTQSVAEIFDGLLAHLETFDFQHMVIQIRRKQGLTKWEKNWEGRMMIEDPFDVNYNMAYRRNGKVLDYIKKTVRRTRDAFLNTDDFEAETVLERCRMNTPLVIEGLRKQRQSTGHVFNPLAEAYSPYNISNVGLPYMEPQEWGRRIEEEMQNLSLRNTYF